MSSSAKRTQDFVPIQEVRDGIVVLKDGSLRAIILASSVNMSLKSEQEQQALISQFQNFLNSLEFSTQITVQSRRLDIRPYLLTLEKRLGEQQEELLRTQTREYIGFIKWFSESVNIMSKNFYVIIPYSYAPLGPHNKTNLLSKFMPGGKGKKEEAAEAFEEQRSQIEERVSVVTQGLTRLGIRTVSLGTQEVIEVYYNMYNPGETQRSIPDIVQHEEKTTEQESPSPHMK